MGTPKKEIEIFIHEQGFNLSGSGVVQNPGKFEGELISTIWYWYQVLEGASDEDLDCDDMIVSIFTVEQEEIDAFETFGIEGVFQAGEEVGFWEDEQGFVHCMLSEEINQIRSTM